MTWFDYDQHARTRPRGDLWGQVRRTVRGVPVGAEQIDAIVSTITIQLELEPEDILLDLACGNGALSERLQPFCRASLGVDVSPYLIGVAEELFASASHSFLVDDAAHFAENTLEAGRFSKALCYGSLSYFADEEVIRTLRALHARFPNVTRVFLGNLPDPARIGWFVAGDSLDLREPRSDIGVWRSAAELAKLAGPGWQITASTMPATFFASHYRFDVILARLS